LRLIYSGDLETITLLFFQLLLSPLASLAKEFHSITGE
jgi:hypothetical protein